MSLEDSIEIRTASHTIFNFFLNLPDNYRKWHSDHLTCKWLKKTPELRGSEIYCEEYIHGALHKIKFRILQIEENRRIEYKNLFPISLISPKGSFIIEEKEKSCIFTARLSFRFSWFLRKFAKNRINLLKIHMAEEGINLKKILED
ncbi:MAG: SRPBCC family protein [Candidatus Hermodarchaeota archaeon]